jgi:probable HAF family extracellular repeat protein
MPLTSIRLQLCLPIGLLAASVVLAQSAPNTAPPQQRLRTYAVTLIDQLSGVFSNTPSLNNKGQIAGEISVDPTDTNFDVVLWENGQITDLGSGQANAINNKGQITGTANGHAVIWENGQVTDLGTGQARDINNKGQVVGTVNNRAVLWDHGQVASLGSLGTSSYGIGINNKGQVVGWAFTGNADDNHAFLWQDGQLTDLGTLPGTSRSNATAINNKGQVVGSSGTPYGGHAVLWQNGQIIDLGTLQGTDFIAGCTQTHNCSSNPSAINNKGQIVGFSETLGGGQHAVLWQNEQITDLNALIPADSGWVLASASDINNKGQIVGLGSYNGEPHAFLLTPEPEPKSSSTLRISNLSWYLGTYPVGQTSATGTIYIYADGPDPVRFADTEIEGPNSEDFFVTANTCGDVLAPYHTCALSFAYKPSLPVWRAAAIALNDNSSGGPYTIPLYGLGY